MFFAHNENCKKIAYKNVFFYEREKNILECFKNDKLINFSLQVKNLTLDQNILIKTSDALIRSNSNLMERVFTGHEFDSWNPYQIFL